MSIKSQKEKFKDVLKHLPHKPGVYRYYNLQGELLYIGKAKNLKKRVSSYFLEGKIHNKRIYLLVNQIDRIEYTIVKTEKESLLLEANLIFNLQPKFNILLKDEQNYFYIRFSYEDEVPAITIERKRLFPKSVYYGPYQSKFKVLAILRTIRMVLPFCEQRKLGACCHYSSIGLCSGVCCKKESLDTYRARLGQIENIFKGRHEDVENYLDLKIKGAVHVENYELAGFWRDRKNLLINMLRSNFAYQKVVLPQPENIDLITLIVEVQPDGVCIGSLFIQNIREGKMVNVNNFLFAGNEFEGEENINESYTEAEETDSMEKTDRLENTKSEGQPQNLEIKNFENLDEKATETQEKINVLKLLQTHQNPQNDEQEEQDFRSTLSKSKKFKTRQAQSFLKQFFQNYYVFNHEQAPILLNIYYKNL